jgi:hypothetical protein
MRAGRLLTNPMILVCALLFAAAGALAGGKDRPVVRGDGQLVRAARPWRGIGVNYFDAFSRTLAPEGDTSYEAGFTALQQAGIPFARIEGCGFWPRDNALYQEDPAAYFRRLDAVAESARRHNVGLILSLFWNPSTVPDMVGEPVSAWGKADSRTRAFMRRYVREVVGRYRHTEAVWGYEFGNEYNLGASLPNASTQRPPVAPALGTPAARSERDEWSYEDIRSAFADFAREVRKNDSRCLIVTGDAFPRESAWHNWKQKSWVHDTPAQFAEMLQDDNPSPVNTISVHAYGDSATRIREASTVARRLRKPLFVGEFGASGVSDKTHREFEALLAAIESEKVPLAAVWVFDYRDQDGEWNVTAANSRSYQLRAIADANGRIARDLREPIRRGASGGTNAGSTDRNLEHTQPNSSVPARRDSGRGSRRCAEPEEPHRLGALRARPQREADVAEGGRSGPDGGPPEARIKAHRVARRSASRARIVRPRRHRAARTICFGWRTSKGFQAARDRLSRVSRLARIAPPRSGRVGAPIRRPSPR